MEDRKAEDSKVAGKEAAEVADGCRCHIGANNPWAVAVPNPNPNPNRNPWAVAVPLYRDHEPSA